MSGPGIEPLHDGDPTWLGPYRLFGRIASGGMGRIYLGRGIDGDLVAVKTLLADGEVSAVNRRRFAREVKIAQQVRAEHTARVLAADPGAERPWMATEYVPAPSLAELVRHAGTLSGSAVRWVARGTVEALVGLHRQGIVHRDVKPQNLLLPAEGPCVIDFGISHAQDLTRTSLSLGTIAFTSPEQARGEESTAASDVYSLGATLFHLAVGRAPYPVGEDTMRLLARVADADVDLTGLPTELAWVIGPCLALEPGDRPTSEEVLSRVAVDLAEAPTAERVVGWLPPRWSALVTEYARHGRDLAMWSWDEDATHTDVDHTADATTDDAATTGAEPPEAPPGRRSRALVRTVRLLMVSILVAIAGFAGIAYWQNERAKEPSSADRAFQALAPGDCLDSTPVAGGWTKRAPRVVDCNLTYAYARVTSVPGVSGGSCPSRPEVIGWLRAFPQGQTFVLCAERLYRVGQCTVGKREGRSITNVQVHEVWDCRTAQLPIGYTELLRIAEYPAAGHECRGPDRDTADSGEYVRYVVRTGEVACLVRL
ncbi:serine/threonine-protein kinase [Embleya hyalina]|uniref:Serine/threonine protein kinase n=1 Tax=Embleya hyalina TaxID=516124 RepID=A0A401Z106_9ACTN|nr:serine/threonine-protein kinase [Embleya hyalina]GCE00603.1 serine/threonine protein kinase [Embleya hyalina]